MVVALANSVMVWWLCSSNICLRRVGMSLRRVVGEDY